MKLALLLASVLFAGAFGTLALPTASADTCHTSLPYEEVVCFPVWTFYCVLYFPIERYPLVPCIVNHAPGIPPRDGSGTIDVDVAIPALPALP